jgi:hypothetical protein
MKLHENLAECNDKIIKKFPLREISNTKSTKETPIISLLNSIGMEQGDAITLGHVLVLGHNPEWNAQIALLIEKAFKDYQHLNSLYRPIKIVGAGKFLLLREKSRANNIYIVIYNDAYIRSADLKKLMQLTTTRFLFKLSGIDWDVMRCEPVVNKRGMEILRSLGINEWYDETELGFLASLGEKELCIESGGEPRRRKLARGVMIEEIFPLGEESFLSREAIERNNKRNESNRKLMEVVRLLEKIDEEVALAKYRFSLLHDGTASGKASEFWRKAMRSAKSNELEC